MSLFDRVQVLQCTGWTMTQVSGAVGATLLK